MLPKLVNFRIHVFFFVCTIALLDHLVKQPIVFPNRWCNKTVKNSAKDSSTRAHLAAFVFVNRTSLWNELAKPSLVPKPVVWTRRTLHQFLPLTRNSFFGATSHFRPKRPSLEIRNRAPLCYLKPREWLTIWYSTSTYHYIADAIRHVT